MKCEHVEADIAKIVAAEAEPVAYEDILKKSRKKMEKGIDRRGEKRYNNQAVSASARERGAGQRILENDTETGRDADRGDGSESARRPV